MQMDRITANRVTPAQDIPAPDGPLSRVRPDRERIMAAMCSAAIATTATIAELCLHGVEGTWPEAIAERAGLTKPQLHCYIAGKEELYEEPYKKLPVQLLHDWKVVFAFEDNLNDPARVLGGYIGRQLDHAFDHPEMSRIFTREVLDGGRNLERYWPTVRAWTQKENRHHQRLDQPQAGAPGGCTAAADAHLGARAA